MRSKFLCTILLSSSFCFSAKAQLNLEWAKSMGGTNYDHGTSVIIDDAGNVYSTGAFSGTADFDPGPSVYNLTGISDIFISKLDAAGSFLWAKSIGGEFGDQGKAIASDPSGNIYITGYFQDTVDFDPGSGIHNLISKGDTDIFICKLDSAGNLLWAKSIGSTGNDHGRSLAVDAPGNVYITGNFNNTADFDTGNGTFELTSSGDSDIFITKLNASGDLDWAKQIGGGAADISESLARDNSGNVFITGRFQGITDFNPDAAAYNLTSAGDTDIFICKLDSLGDFLWAKSIGSNGSDGSNSVAVDQNGNAYTTGFFSGTVDFDPGTGIYNLVGSGQSFISKLNPSGDFVWANQFSGIGDHFVTQSYSLAIDLSGNVYLCGASFKPAQIGISAADDDLLIRQYDPLGMLVWEQGFPGTGNSIGNSIAVDQTGKIYITGYYSNSTDFDPQPATYNLSSAGNADLFILKLNTIGVSLAEYSDNSSITNFIYPNPSNGSFILQSDLKFNTQLQIEILDLTGKLIKPVNSSAIGFNSLSINVSEISCGLYLLKVSDDNYTGIFKIIINK
ncbi:MAG TPA: SBBP repeat-containing protein [Bacteroidia bacterium]|jgi:hypothetical protein